MKRILIMEDDTALALQWSDAFGLNGFHVSLASSGDEAVEFLEQDRFAVVVTA